jgi:hypothetical protein
MYDFVTEMSLQDSVMDYRIIMPHKNSTDVPLMLGEERVTPRRETLCVCSYESFSL